jgi:hypothetical protein
MVKDGIGNYILASTLFNRTNMIYMKTSLSPRRLKYIIYSDQDYSFFIISLFNQLYVKAGMLLTCRKYLHDCIILQRREV